MSLHDKLLALDTHDHAGIPFVRLDDVLRLVRQSADDAALKVDKIDLDLCHLTRYGPGYSPASQFRTYISLDDALGVVRR